MDTVLPQQPHSGARGEDSGDSNAPDWGSSAAGRRQARCLWLVRGGLYASIVNGARRGRLTRALACSSPMKSSFSGSHCSFRFSSMAMFDK